jgi:dTDP-glucose 4,6-dehydratase
LNVTASKRIIITGGAGFIGSGLVRHLIAETSHSVLVIDKLTYAGNLDNLATVAGDPRLAFVRADVADRTKMRDLMRGFAPQIIVHLAAESHVDRSIAGPGVFMETNVVGTFSLLEAALDHWRQLEPAARESFRFHHVSTDEVFGTLGEEGYFDETSPYQPNSPYAATKAASDHLVRAWNHTYGLPIVLSNCSNNYGPYQFPEKLVPRTIVNALEGHPVPVYGRGENVRDWLYVEDHARALILIAEQGGIGESYNVGGGSERRNIEVVRAVCAMLDEIAPDPKIGPREQLLTFVEDRPGHDLRYAINAAKIRRELGWAPRERFETGLRKTVEWFLANRAWWTRIRSGRSRRERQGAVA